MVGVLSVRMIVPDYASRGHPGRASRPGDPHRSRTTEEYRRVPVHAPPIGRSCRGPGQLGRAHAGLAGLLAVVGIAWMVVYINVAQDGESLTWMGDLMRWNFLIGFGLIFLALAVAANPGTPLGRGRGVVVGMLGCFLLGLIWIVVYYIAGADLADPADEEPRSVQPRRRDRLHGGRLRLRHALGVAPAGPPHPGTGVTRDVAPVLHICGQVCAPNYTGEIHPHELSPVWITHPAPRLADHRPTDGEPEQPADRAASGGVTDAASRRVRTCGGAGSADGAQARTAVRATIARTSTGREGADPDRLPAAPARSGGVDDHRGAARTPPTKPPR